MKMNQCFAVGQDLHLKKLGFCLLLGLFAGQSFGQGSAVVTTGGSSPPDAVPVVPNQAPVANDDTYRVNQDTALSPGGVGVLGNDSDNENDTLTAVKASDPGNGSVVLNSNGSFTYTPLGGFAGADSFSYFPNDGFVDGNTATVSITVIAVLPPDQPPQAVDDVYVTEMDSALSPGVGVLHNDHDPDNDPLTATVQSMPAQGSLNLLSNGNFTYTPTAGFVGTDSFQYVANDGTLNSMSATVTITVTPAAIAMVTPVRAAVCSGAVCGLFPGFDPVEQCPDAKPYAMTSVHNELSGDKMFTKKCASQYECETLWWQQTSDLDVCINFDQTQTYPFPFACHFCCVTDECNLNDIRPMSDLFKGKA